MFTLPRFLRSAFAVFPAIGCILAGAAAIADGHSIISALLLFAGILLLMGSFVAGEPKRDDGPYASRAEADLAVMKRLERFGFHGPIVELGDHVPDPPPRVTLR